MKVVQHNYSPPLRRSSCCAAFRRSPLTIPICLTPRADQRTSSPLPLSNVGARTHAFALKFLGFSLYSRTANRDNHSENYETILNSGMFASVVSICVTGLRWGLSVAGFVAYGLAVLFAIYVACGWIWHREWLKGLIGTLRGVSFERSFLRLFSSLSCRLQGRNWPAILAVRPRNVRQTLNDCVRSNLMRMSPSVDKCAFAESRPCSLGDLLLFMTWCWRNVRPPMARATSCGGRGNLRAFPLPLRAPWRKVLQAKATNGNVRTAGGLAGGDMFEPHHQHRRRRQLRCVVCVAAAAMPTCGWYYREG
jgi:hypothetical protein